MNHLVHHGIKGMHWGIRRYQPYPKGHVGGKEIGEAAKAKIREAKAKREYSKGAYARSKSMTDEELRTANKRYQAEQQYRDNVRKDVEAGRNAAQKNLSKAKGIAVSAVVGAVAGGTGAMVGKGLLNTGKAVVANSVGTLSMPAYLIWLFA